MDAPSDIVTPTEKLSDESTHKRVPIFIIGVFFFFFGIAVGMSSLFLWQRSNTPMFVPVDSEVEMSLEKGSSSVPSAETITTSSPTSVATSPVPLDEEYKTHSYKAQNISSWKKYTDDIEGYGFIYPAYLDMTYLILEADSFHVYGLFQSEEEATECSAQVNKNYSYENSCIQNAQFIEVALRNKGKIDQYLQNFPEDLKSVYTDILGRKWILAVTENNDGVKTVEGYLEVDQKYYLCIRNVWMNEGVDYSSFIDPMGFTKMMLGGASYEPNPVN